MLPILFLWCSATVATATADPAVALRELTDAADRICGANIPLDNSTQTILARGKIDAELNALVKKLVGAGLSTDAELRTEKHSGLLQDQLLQAMHNQGSCKLEAIGTLREFYLPGSLTNNNASGPCSFSGQNFGNNNPHCENYLGAPKRQGYLYQKGREVGQGFGTVSVDPDNSGITFSIGMRFNPSYSPDEPLEFGDRLIRCEHMPEFSGGNHFYRGLMHCQLLN